MSANVGRLCAGAAVHLSTSARRAAAGCSGASTCHMAATRNPTCISQVSWYMLGGLCVCTCVCMCVCVCVCVSYQSISDILQIQGKAPHFHVLPKPL